jgi:transcriptional regulator with XRE-family HTH domain
MSQDEIGIGAKLAKIRRDRNWSQAQLASALNVHQSSICRIESGDEPKGAMVRVIDLVISTDGKILDEFLVDQTVSAKVGPAESEQAA